MTKKSIVAPVSLAVPYRDSFPIAEIQRGIAIVRSGEIVSNRNELGFCGYQLWSFTQGYLAPWPPTGGPEAVHAPLAAESKAACGELHALLDGEQKREAFKLGGGGGWFQTFLPFFMSLLKQWMA